MCSMVVRKRGGGVGGGIGYPKCCCETGAQWAESNGVGNVVGEICLEGCKLEIPRKRCKTQGHVLGI